MPAGDLSGLTLSGLKSRTVQVANSDVSIEESETRGSPRGGLTNQMERVRLHNESCCRGTEHFERRRSIAQHTLVLNHNSHGNHNSHRCSCCGVQMLRIRLAGKTRFAKCSSERTEEALGKHNTFLASCTQWLSSCKTRRQTVKTWTSLCFTNKHWICHEMSWDFESHRSTISQR